MPKEDVNTLMFVNKDMSKGLGDFLKEKGLSGRMIKRALSSNAISIEGSVCKGSETVPRDAAVCIELADEKSDMKPQKMKLEILYEDLDLLVLNKEPFTLVHPTPNHPDGTLSNGVASYFLESGLKRKIRILNRLDRDTSGIIIFPKNSFGHQQLASQMDQGKVEKIYLAIVHGTMEKDSGEINLPLGKHDDGIRQTVRNDGMEAITRYKVLERMGGGTLVELELLTGRTHQIRVHLSHLGYPIMGDHLYSQEEAQIGRQALHAHELSFLLPRTHRRVTLRAEIPEDMKNLINLLKSSKN
ncbi:RluA family pseudouridine synthase [Gudongella sp. SC589]|uniref:RluA family pseudouridine synthase n=1 Tax=Gudongella sp. SC589 TaxID=3385990 RepID=UPI003904B15E